MKKMNLAIVCLLSAPLSAMELTAEQKEAAFNARMLAMREEQARRAQGSRTHLQETAQTQIHEEQARNRTQQPMTQRVPERVEIPPEYEYKPHHYNSEGETKTTNEKTCTAFTTDFCSPKLEQTYLSQGYKKVILRNGLIGFCKPGYEHHLALFERAHQNTHNSQNN